MKVFLVTGNRAASVPGSTIFRDNVLAGLTASGHSVTIFNFEDEIHRSGATDPAKIRDVCTEGLLREFRQGHERVGFDVALCFVNNLVVHPPALKDLTDRIPTVNYTTNYHQFHLVEDVARYVTLTTYISLPAAAAFGALGVASFWLPMAASPSQYPPSENKTRFALFVGTAYGERPYYAWRLLQRGIDVDVSGPFWKRRSAPERWLRNVGEPLLYVFGKNTDRLKFLSRNERRIIIDHLHQTYPERLHASLGDLEMASALASSHVVVNLAESRFNHDFLDPRVLRGCNLRDFEVPMAGACLATQHSEEIGQFYEPGKEVLTFHDDVDLADKLEFYSSRRDALAKIAQAGHRRALLEHTWERRFSKLFEHMGLN